MSNHSSKTQLTSVIVSKSVIRCATCNLAASDQAFMFFSVYSQFLEYLSEQDTDVTGVCMSKSRLLTYILR